MDVLTTIYLIFVGTALGIVINNVYHHFSKKKIDGRIVVNRSDPDFATAGIEFYIGANDIEHRKYVMLEVKDIQ